MKIKLDSESVILGLDMYYAEEWDKAGYNCPMHNEADDILGDIFLADELFHYKDKHCGMCD